MSNYNSLKATIDANIKQNGNQEITGQILNSVLNQMVNILGAGYQFAGIATIDTNPGTPDAKVFYIANGKGTYEKFGGINVTEGDVVVLYYDTTWHKAVTGIASQAKLSELESEVIYDISAHNDGAVFESLQALLSSSNLNTLIPTSVRHGGMSIRFIQGSASNSDNKYVQYRLMTTSFSITESDWQGIDNIYEKFDSISRDYISLAETGLVSSVDGSYSNIVPTSNSKRVTINLINTQFTTIKFKTSVYSGEYGYGFFVNGAWQGVHTTENKEVIINIPQGATEFRACWNTSIFAENYYICSVKNNSIGAYDIRENKININNIKTRLNTVEENTTEIKEGLIVEEEVETIEKGYVSSVDGSYGGETSTSKRITINLVGKPYTHIKFWITAYGGEYGYGFFVNGAWQGVHTTETEQITITIPEGATEFRACWNASNLSENHYICIYSSDLSTEHNDFVKRDKDIQVSLQGQIDNIKDLVNSIILPRPFALPMPACDGSNGGINLNTITVSDIYQLWDNLVAEYPYYLSSSDLGPDESGEYQLRKIVVKRRKGDQDQSHPDDYPYDSVKPNRNVIITANIHGPGAGGDTRMQAYIVYYFIKWLLDNKDSNNDAQWFLLNYSFVIVPIANPWGFDNNSRHNSRGVDLNRNFDADWVSGQNKGASAASEKETQYIQNVISNNVTLEGVDTYMYLDFHSHMYGNSYLQYLPNSDSQLYANAELCRKQFKFLSPKQTISFNYESEGGMAKRYAEVVCGINGIVLEAAPYDGISDFSALAMTNSMRLFTLIMRADLL